MCKNMRTYCTQGYCIQYSNPDYCTQYWQTQSALLYCHWQSETASGSTVILSQYPCYYQSINNPLQGLRYNLLGPRRYRYSPGRGPRRGRRPEHVYLFAMFICFVCLCVHLSAYSSIYLYVGGAVYQWLPDAQQLLTKWLAQSESFNDSLTQSHWQWVTVRLSVSLSYCQWHSPMRHCI